MGHYSDKHYTQSNDFDRFYYSILFRKGDKILDIACSTGNFMAQDPKNITGIDIDEDSVKIAKKRGLNASLHNAAKSLPFRDNSIENVHCRHLLEHLEEPLGFMKDIFRVLRKKGRLVLLTDRMSEHFWDDYTHKKPFTKKSLEQLAYDAGFRNYEVYEFPSQGVLGLGLLHGHKVVSSKSAGRIYGLFGKFFGTHSIMLQAVK